MTLDQTWKHRHGERDGSRGPTSAWRETGAGQACSAMAAESFLMRTELAGIDGSSGVAGTRQHCTANSLNYHQGDTLKRNIARYVRQSGAQSLLDIGAGAPSMASSLAQLVPVYCGVERDATRAYSLQSAGLNVVCGTFPEDGNQGAFDFVLASHSIPENDLSAYPAFLSNAVSRLTIGGMFLIVTFKGNNGDLLRISKELLGQAGSISEERSVIEEFLQARGEYSVECVNSYIESNNKESLAEFLLPWLTGDQALQKRLHPKFLDIIEARYFVKKDFYVFPTEHLFIAHRRLR